MFKKILQHFCKDKFINWHLFFTFFIKRSGEVGLEVNPEKIKYMVVSRYQKTGQRQSLKIGNRSFESVAKFEYLGTTLTDQNIFMKRLRAE
jgi:hypothetical protein